MHVCTCTCTAVLRHAEPVAFRSVVISSPLHPGVLIFARMYFYSLYTAISYSTIVNCGTL
eukprot:COSAG02_NODE_2482_length_8724_cov_136.350609_1_plen_60_part_00